MENMKLLGLFLQDMHLCLQCEEPATVKEFTVDHGEGLCTHFSKWMGAYDASLNMSSAWMGKLMWENSSPVTLSKIYPFNKYVNSFIQEHRSNTMYDNKYRLAFIEKYRAKEPA